MDKQWSAILQAGITNIVNDVWISRNNTLFKNGKLDCARLKNNIYNVVNISGNQLSSVQNSKSIWLLSEIMGCIVKSSVYAYFHN